MAKQKIVHVINFSWKDILYSSTKLSVSAYSPEAPAQTQAAVAKRGLDAADGVATGSEHLRTASAANKAALDEVYGLVSSCWTVCSLLFPFQKVDALQSYSEGTIGETWLLHKWLSEARPNTSLGVWGNSSLYLGSRGGRHSDTSLNLISLHPQLVRKLRLGAMESFIIMVSIFCVGPDLTDHFVCMIV